MEELLQKLEEIAQKLDKLSQGYERKDVKWLFPDEASIRLGFRISKSGNHRRRLKALIDAGIIKNARKGRPYVYDEVEIDNIAEKIRKGKISLP